MSNLDIDELARQRRGIPPALMTAQPAPAAVAPPAVPSVAVAPAGMPLGGGVAPPTLGAQAANVVKTVAGKTADIVGGVNDIVGFPSKLAGRTAATALGDYANAMVPGGVGAGITDMFNPTPGKDPTNVATDGGVARVVAPPAVAPAAAARAPAVAPPTTLPSLLTDPITRGVTPAGAPMQLAQAPAQTPMGPLPQLKAEQGQNVFSAMMSLSGDMAKYRDTAIANGQAKGAFNDMLKAGKFNLDAIKDKSQIQLAFNDDERKSMESEIKERSAEAMRVLSTGKYDKAQEAGLRLLAGLGDKKNVGKYKPGTIFGAPDENGVQAKMLVSINTEDNSVIPIHIPGFNTADKVGAGPSGPPGSKPLMKPDGTGQATKDGKPVFVDAQGKQVTTK